LGTDKIRLNIITPGWIMTQRQIDLWLTPDAEVDLMKVQCLKEKLYPPDIARMVLWLASDDSRLVTAQNFVVDGGRMGRQPPFRGWAAPGSFPPSGPTPPP